MTGEPGGSGSGTSSAVDQWQGEPATPDGVTVFYQGRWCCSTINPLQPANRVGFDGKPFAAAAGRIVSFRKQMGLSELVSPAEAQNGEPGLACLSTQTHGSFLSSRSC